MYEPCTDRGAKVLVLERETQFKDRVRGEGVTPWGVAEANELGIRNLLKQQQRNFRTCHTVEGWSRTLFQDPSPESAALRARAMPRIAEDPTRVPDHIFSGPGLPMSEQVRARFFGEC